MFISRDISIVTGTLSAMLDIHGYAEMSQVLSRNIFQSKNHTVVRTETFKVNNGFPNDFLLQWCHVAGFEKP